MKFYEEIECEHGWTDTKGFAHCELGSGCSIGLVSYCVKEDCPIIDEDEAEGNSINEESDYTPERMMVMYLNDINDMKG
jgi:hypothetical protein